MKRLVTDRHRRSGPPLWACETVWRLSMRMWDRPTRHRALGQWSLANSTHVHVHEIDITHTGVHLLEQINVLDSIKINKKIIKMIIESTIEFDKILVGWLWPTDCRTLCNPWRRHKVVVRVRDLAGCWSRSNQDQEISPLPFK